MTSKAGRGRQDEDCILSAQWALPLFATTLWVSKFSRELPEAHGPRVERLSGNEAYVFIDDVIVYGNTIEEHARRLGNVLERFDRANLKLQPGKCVCPTASGVPWVHNL